MDSDKQESNLSSDFSRTLGRREFVTKATLSGVALAIGTSAWAGVSVSPSTSSSRGTGKMSKRHLGKLQVSAIGAGCMSISANYGPPADIDQGINTLRTAFEKGVTFLTPPKSTARTQTKNWLVKPSSRSETKYK